MDSRELKALLIAAKASVTFKNGTWTVPSLNGNSSYRVAFARKGATCTCDDWMLRRQDCKHILAARLVAEREGGPKSPPIDTDTLPIKKKYTQNWSTYNEAQITEKRRFQELLVDLCRGVPELPSKGGRPRTPIADVIFACAFKVYSTFSSRRFGSDLADALEKGHLSRPIHPNRVNCCLENPDLTPVLRDLIVTSSLPLKSVEDSFAPDSTGFSAGRFDRWYDTKYGVSRAGRAWVKAHAICGTKTHVVTGVEILDQDAADSPQFAPLVKVTAKNFKINKVTADKGYLSKGNLELVDRLGGAIFIPFKSNSVAGKTGSMWEKMFLYYNLRREEFLKHYHSRSNVESTFSMVKAKFRDHVRSRTDAAMKNEVYCKFLCHNICAVIRSQLELGIEAEFWKVVGKKTVVYPASRKHRSAA